MARTEQDWQTCWCCRDQRWAWRNAQASAEKFEQTEPGEKGGLSAKNEQLARTLEPLLPKGKGTESSWDGRMSRWARVVPWWERGGSKQEHVEERVSSTVKENEFQEGDEWQAVSLPCKSKRKHEWVSGPKCFPGRSKKSCFHCKSGQTWSRKRFGEGGPAHKRTKQNESA